MSYSTRVDFDEETAEVILETRNGVEGTVARLGPRQARRVAIQMLQVANHVDDLRDARE